MALIELDGELLGNVSYTQVYLGTVTGGLNIQDSSGNYIQTGYNPTYNEHFVFFSDAAGDLIGVGSGGVSAGNQSGDAINIGFPLGSIYLSSSNGAVFHLEGSNTFIFSQLSVYANNAAAISGGLIAGTLYRTGSDPDQICIVH